MKKTELKPAPDFLSCADMLRAHALAVTTLEEAEKAYSRSLKNPTTPMTIPERLAFSVIAAAFLAASLFFSSKASILVALCVGIAVGAIGFFFINRKETTLDYQRRYESCKARVDELEPLRLHHAGRTGVVEAILCQCWREVHGED